MGVREQEEMRRLLNWTHGAAGQQEGAGYLERMSKEHGPIAPKSVKGEIVYTTVDKTQLGAVKKQP